MFVGFPNPPDSWSESDKSRYKDSMPSNFKSFRSLKNELASHVICSDNVIRAFYPKRSDDTVGVVIYKGSKVAGEIESHGNFDFFVPLDIVGNVELPFDIKVKALQHYLSLIEDPDYVKREQERIIERYGSNEE